MIFGVVAALQAGCGSAQQQAPNEVDQGMKKALALYMHYVRNHSGRSPANEKEFRDYLNTIPKKDLEGMKVDSIDEAMKSPRDGQPYGVVYGVTMGAPGQARPGGGGPPGKGANEKPKDAKSSGPAVVLYEKQGKGGRRYVAYSMGGMVVEIDDAQFKDLVPNPS